VIVVTGKLPKPLFDAMRFAAVYQVRTNGLLYLLTQTYPSFSAE
jgi:hypothetical protein